MFAFGLVPLMVIPAYLHRKRMAVLDRVRGEIGVVEDDCCLIQIPYSKRRTMEDVMSTLELYTEIVHAYDDMASQTWVYKCKFRSTSDFYDLMNDEEFDFKVSGDVYEYDAEKIEESYDDCGIEMESEAASSSGWYKMWWCPPR